MVVATKRRRDHKLGLSRPNNFMTRYLPTRLPQNGRMSTGPLIVHTTSSSRKLRGPPCRGLTGHGKTPRQPRAGLGSFVPPFRPVNRGCIEIPLPVYGEGAAGSPEQRVPPAPENFVNDDNYLTAAPVKACAQRSSNP